MMKIWSFDMLFYDEDEIYSYKGQIERRIEIRKNLSFITLRPKSIKGFNLYYNGWLHVCP